MKKNKKLWLLLIMAVICFSFMTTTAFASNNIKVVVNGDNLVLDVAPVVENGRVLLPMRAISEALGATVDYQAVTKQVTVQRSSDTIIIDLGQKNATVNGVIVPMDVAAKAVSGRTLLPLRFVSESLDAQVDWNNSTKVVSITAAIPVEMSGWETQLLTLINSERSKKGLSACTISAELSNMAKDHTMDMITEGFFSHNSLINGDTATRAAVYGLSNVGENLAYGYPSPQSTMTAFMNDSEYKANIISSYVNYVGIGVYKKAGTHNTDVYVTVTFSN